MTFTSPFLDRLRALRGPTPAPEQPVTPPAALGGPEAPALGPVTTHAQPVPAPAPRPSPTPPAPRPQPRPAARPSVSDRAGMTGHCGTCRAFNPDPSEGRYMGVCAHGRGAFEPWARHSRAPAVIHEAARCMTQPFPRWALRPGVNAQPDTDTPREVRA